VLDDKDDTVYTIDPGADRRFLSLDARRQIALEFPGRGGLAAGDQLASQRRPAKFWGVTMPLGVAGDYTGIATYLLLARSRSLDARWIIRGDVVPRHPPGHQRPGRHQLRSVSGGQLVKMEKSGRYLLLGAIRTGRVTEVLGLDSIKRRPCGTFVLQRKPTLRRRLKPWLSSEKLKSKSQALVVVRGKALAGIGQRSHEGARWWPRIHEQPRFAYDDHNFTWAYEVESTQRVGQRLRRSPVDTSRRQLLDIQIAGDAKAIRTHEARAR